MIKTTANWQKILIISCTAITFCGNSAGYTIDLQCPSTFTLNEAKTMAAQGLNKNGIFLKAKESIVFKKSLPGTIQIGSKAVFSPKLIANDALSDGSVQCSYEVKPLIGKIYILDVVASKNNLELRKPGENELTKKQLWIILDAFGFKNQAVEPKPEELIKNYKVRLLGFHPNGKSPNAKNYEVIKSFWEKLRKYYKIDFVMTDEQVKKALDEYNKTNNVITKTSALQYFGLSASATAAEITKEYRKKALMLHPDKAKDDGKAFQILQQNYDVLKPLYGIK